MLSDHCNLSVAKHFDLQYSLENVGIQNEHSVPTLSDKKTHPTNKAVILNFNLNVIFCHKRDRDSFITKMV